jgi:rRNA biogenesis protein RRP5
MLSLRVADVCAGMDSAAAHVGAVLPACIRTVEDHGCSLTLGVPGVSAFLPLADYHATFGSNVQPVPGQIMQVVIKKLLRGGKDAVVGCEATEIASSMLRGEHAIMHGNLLPGQLVTVCAKTTLI